MIDQNILGLINGAVKTALSLDPDSREQLSKLQGKVFCLQFRTPDFCLYLIPDDDGLSVSNDYDDEPDVTLEGNALAFLRLAVQGTDTMTEGDIQLKGDAESGQRLQKILSQMDLDWEELIARAIGDTPARKAGNLIRGAGEWLKETIDYGRENTADYFREERKVLVSRIKMEDFETDVKVLRQQVDRLESRVSALKTEIEN